MGLRALVATTLLVVAGCATAPPVASTPTVTPSAPPDTSVAPAGSSNAAPAGTPTPSPSPSPSPSPAASPLVTVDPGRPYDAQAILDAMAASRRPGGVAPELQVPAVAEAVAASLWTFDGQPWVEIASVGACGPERCTLELAGTRPGAAGDDVYRFSVDRATGFVRLTTADLHAHPVELQADLDTLVRASPPPELSDEMRLASARWLPPPDHGQFVLVYRSGGEEGSPGIEIVVDLTAGDVVEVRD